MSIRKQLGILKRTIFFKIPKLSKEKKYIFLFLAPCHGNLGDAAILSSELLYIKDNMPEYEVVIINEYCTDIAITQLRKNIRSFDIIMLHGGGNFGDLYLNYEEDRRNIVQSFPDINIVQFPESVHYDRHEEYRLTQYILGKHKALWLIAREKESYERLQKMFPNKVNHIILWPDIVFYNTPSFKDKVRNNSILFLMRDDKERAVSRHLIDQIKSELLSIDKFYFSFNSNVVNNKIRCQKQRDSILKNQFNEIQKHNLIVTDRLHGVIFAYLLGVPCIALENNNDKIKSTYDTWLKDCNFISLMSSSSTANDIALQVIKMKTINPRSLNLKDRFMN